MTHHNTTLLPTGLRSPQNTVLYRTTVLGLVPVDHNALRGAPSFYSLYQSGVQAHSASVRLHMQSLGGTMGMLENNCSQGNNRSLGITPAGASQTGDTVPATTSWQDRPHHCAQA